MVKTDEICDFIEPLKAWKVFAFNGKHLSSLNGWTWDGNAERALCFQEAPYRPASHGDVPAPNCTCGIYSLKSPVPDCFPVAPHFDPQLSVHGRKIGWPVACEVEVWGGVVRHVDGFRSEYCKALRVYLNSQVVEKLAQVGDAGKILGRLKSPDLDFCVYRRVCFRLWLEGRPEFVPPGSPMTREGVGVTVSRRVPFWPFHHTGAALFRTDRMESATRVVPFHSVEWIPESGDMIVNFETEESYATRQSNRQSEGGGEGDLTFGRYQRARRGVLRSLSANGKA